MPTKLKNLRLDEVSLVDTPANQHAKVTIFKRDVAGPSGVSSGDKGEIEMTPEELAKKLSDLEGEVAKLTEERDEAVSKLAEVEKKAEEVEKEYVEIDGEKVEKSLVPAPILKQLENQAEAIAKMQADLESKEFAKKADDMLGNLPGDATVKGAILKAVSEVEGAEDVLKKADALAKSAMSEVGSDVVDENSPEVKLDNMAKAYAKEKGVSYAKAYAEVTSQGEGLELFNKRHAA